MIRLVAILCLTSLMACNKDSGPIAPGDDPNFTIVANEDNVLKKCNRKVVVFGIDIYAVPEYTDANLLHTANVMAQYLDNDEDGEPDNPVVLEQMKKNKAFMVLWKKQRDLLGSFPSGRTGQDLGNDETNPAFVRDGKMGSFDASLEEVFHIITHAGYAPAYPSVFGEKEGSEIAKAMDKARGGVFTSIPKQYDSDAWYTYTDKTCKYDCQVTEYHYWALTSILGAQENRSDEIGHEWKLNTMEQVQEKDPAVYALLTNPEYAFPTVLPDGTYKQ